MDGGRGAAVIGCPELLSAMVLESNASPLGFDVEGGSAAENNRLCISPAPVSQGVFPTALVPVPAFISIVVAGQSCRIITAM